jgi:hypothetical protein
MELMKPSVGRGYRANETSCREGDMGLMKPAVERVKHGLMKPAVERVIWG